MTPDQLEVAQGGRHQDVGPAPASYKRARDVLAVAWKMPGLGHAQHVLSRSRFMLNVPRVYICAAFDQVPRNLDRGRQVEGRLTVPSASADQARIRHNEFLEPVKHREPRCCVSIENGAAFDQKCSHIRSAVVEDADAAGPGTASRV